MLYQLSYDPLWIPPTYRIFTGGPVGKTVRLMKANDR